MVLLITFCLACNHDEVLPSVPFGFSDHIPIEVELFGDHSNPLEIVGSEFYQNPNTTEDFQILFFEEDAAYQLNVLGKDGVLTLPLEVFEVNPEKFHITNSDDTITYKTTDSIDLKFFLYLSEGTRDKVMILFSGGSWSTYSIYQFHAFSNYLRSKGISVISAEYRVKDYHSATIGQAIDDSRDVFNYVFENKVELGLSSNSSFYIGGASAGGHLAIGMILPFTASDISSTPIDQTQVAGIFLFNPVLDTGPTGYNQLDRKEISPLHNIVISSTPVFIFHGKGDISVPFESVSNCTLRMWEEDNNCLELTI